MTLPDGNPVWIQANAKGERYVPFRLDIKNSKSTWTGSLPHDRADQVDARNHGRHDRWLPAKRSGHPAYAEMPLTLGYYTRAEFPLLLRPGGCVYDLRPAFLLVPDADDSQSSLPLVRDDSRTAGGRFAGQRSQ